VEEQWAADLGVDKKTYDKWVADGSPELDQSGNIYDVDAEAIANSGTAPAPAPEPEHHGSSEDG